MRDFKLLGVASLAALTACAARAHDSTLPRRYDCGGRELVQTGGSLVVDGVPAMAFRGDDDGADFVLSEARTLTEYLVPRDPRADVVVHTYEPTASPDRSSWIPRGRALCPATGGYTDALERFMRGANTDEVALQLALDPADARKLIWTALSRLRRRVQDSEP
jgi:hypothetical protein